MTIRTNEDLLDKIKRKSFIPTSQSTFSNDDILKIASEEMRGVIVPTILNTREDYFTYKQEFTLDGSTNPVFNIPHRSIGMQLREVSITIGNVERNIPRLDIEDRVYDNLGGVVYGYDITNNQLNVKGSNTGTLNMYYYLRPGDLVQSNTARAIVSANTTLKQITLSTIPATWTTANTFDVVKCRAGFDTKSIDLTVSNIDTGSNIITFNESLPEVAWNMIVAGDWLTLSETSPVPQLPLEWQEYLAEAVTCYMMESLGDGEAFERARIRKDELKRLAVDSIAPRVDGQSKKLVPRRNRGASVYNSSFRNY